jgi:hypothetical protein
VIVARCWAMARAEGRHPNGHVTGVRRHGWSNESQQAAEAHARQRAEADLARRLGGEVVPHTERRLPYCAEGGLPIREEIVDELPDAVITRNTYGALCLNTEQALFVDVDWPLYREPMSCGFGCLFALSIPASLATAAWLYGAPTLLLIVAWFVAHRLELRRIGPPPGEDRDDWKALDPARRWCAEHPAWRVRVYRSPNGLRRLAVHAPVPANSDEALAFMQAVRADPQYVRLCRLQQCSRARLSPKPWRMTEPLHRLPKRLKHWPPLDEGRRAERAAWCAEYDAASARYRACAFRTEIGVGRVDPALAGLIALHDDRSGALRDLPTA